MGAYSERGIATHRAILSLAMPLVVYFKEILAMRQVSVSVGAGLVFLVSVCACGPAYGDPGQEADLLSRIMALEERVAQLEQTIKKLEASASEPPRTQTETKLIGTWAVAEADRQTVAFPDMKFKRDGTCAAVWNPRPAEKDAAQLEMQIDAEYQVIGTQLTIEHRYKQGGGIYGNYRITLITDEELVLSWERQGKVTTMRYLRVK